MQTHTQILLSVMLFILLASLVEAICLVRRQAYDWKAMGVSMLNFLVRNAVLIALPFSLATPVMHWAQSHRLFALQMTAWHSWLLLFLGQEFCYYWFHRTSHRVRYFWASHAVHHSPNQLNLSASYRSAVFGKLSGDTLFFAPLVWLGFPARVVAAMVAFNLLYQTWVHVTWIPRLGWLEWVFNTPSAHRVHHAANLDYLDANYGGVLIVFDRLFGTYRPERPDEPCRYGWVRPQTSHHPLRVEFDTWLALLRDLWHARSLGAFAGLLLRPPGWSPSGPGETTEALRAQAQVKAQASAPSGQQTR